MKRYLTLTALLLVLALLTACSGSAPAVTETPESSVIPETTAVPETPRTRTVLETLTIEAHIGDLVISTVTEYSYNEMGLLTEVIGYSNGEEVSRTTVENDEHGEVIRQVAVSGGVTTITESENTYDEAGNLISKVDTVSVDGTVTDIREYAYAPGGRLLEALFTTQGDNGYTTGNRYEYDENGRQTAEIYLSADGSEARKETEYNESGDPIRSVTTNSDGVVTVETDYIYLEDGSIKTVSGQGWNLNTYDEQGNPLCSEAYTSDGTLMQRISYTYITVPAFK